MAKTNMKARKNLVTIQHLIETGNQQFVLLKCYLKLLAFCSKGHSRWLKIRNPMAYKKLQ